LCPELKYRKRRMRRRRMMKRRRRRPAVCLTAQGVVPPGGRGAERRLEAEERNNGQGQLGLHRRSQEVTCGLRRSHVVS